MYFESVMAGFNCVYVLDVVESHLHLVEKGGFAPSSSAEKQYFMHSFLCLFVRFDVPLDVSVGLSLSSLLFLDSPLIRIRAEEASARVDAGTLRLND